MTILKFIKYFLLIVLVLASVIMAILYFNLNYKMYSLKADQSLYSQKIWEINTDSLSIELLSQMSLEEKIDQMYGEKMYKSIPKFFGNFLLKQRFS